MRRLPLPLLLLLVAGPVPAAVRPPAGGTAVLELTEAFTSADPLAMHTVSDLFVVRNVHATLFELRAGQAVPALVSGHRIGADGRELELELRERVGFHDGRPLTARDVVYSLKRAAADPRCRFLANAEITAAGPLVVRIRTDRPEPDLPARLASPHLAILPAEIDRSHPGFGRRPVGLGPFRFDGNLPGGGVRLAAGRPAPFLASVEIRPAGTAVPTTDGFSVRRRYLLAGRGPSPACLRYLAVLMRPAAFLAFIFPDGQRIDGSEGDIGALEATARAAGPVPDSIRLLYPPGDRLLAAAAMRACLSVRQRHGCVPIEAVPGTARAPDEVELLPSFDGSAGGPDAIPLFARESRPSLPAGLMLYSPFDLATAWMEP